MALVMAGLDPAIQSQKLNVWDHMNLDARLNPQIKSGDGHDVGIIDSTCRHAVRLGMSMVRGLAKDAATIIAARADR